MRKWIYILLTLFVAVITVNAQGSGSRPGQGGFSLSNLTQGKGDIPDSLLLADSVSSARITAFRLTPQLGDAYIAPMDTNRLNTANSMLPEGKSLGVMHLANIGSAAQSLIFNERKLPRDFYFADPFDYYITTPENALFYDTKDPYTHVTYNTDFSSRNKGDQLKGLLTLNFGKRLNVGFEADYIYSRGFYNSNGNKLLNYRFFASYKSDRYEAKAHANNFNFVYHENGGLTNDDYVNYPDSFAGRNKLQSTSFPVRYTNYFNRVRGKNFFLNHRYNLGFYRTLEIEDEEGNPLEAFVPVSSIIHTLSYEDNRRHAYAGASETRQIDATYDIRFRPDTLKLDDRASYWKLTNVVGLSLREGFQDWVKFGLTAFVNLEKRQYKLPEYYGVELTSTTANSNYIIEQPDWEKMQVIDEFSTFIGAELSKRQGSLLTYIAKGELGIVGDDIGEFRLNGELQSRFPLFKKEATIKAEGYIYNVNPAFFYRKNSSRYFQWDNRFSKERRIYAGGEVDLDFTKTKISAGVTNLQNYIYFNRQGYPEQHGSNIQIITARLKQNFYYRAFGWENEVAYQLSSNKDVLPLPTLTAYSNIYVAFKPVKVLTVQLGADVHYYTEYYAPYYEPGILQFHLQKNDQNKTKVGNYPLINLYANFHLKQARFFLNAYNLGSKFVFPNYFSLAHYPLDPMVIKVGVSVYFNN